MGPMNFLLQLLLIHLVGLYGLLVYADTVNITLSTGNAVSLCLLRSSTERIWNVTGPPGSQVELNCAHVTLLESADCVEGFLSILDTVGEEKICKDIRNLARVSIENWMNIHFKRVSHSGGRLNCFVGLKKTDGDAEGTPSPSTASGATVTGDHMDLIDQDNKNTSNRCQRNNKKRIIGGAKTGENEYTFMAYLMKEKTLECGGSILTKRHVLTAAHCKVPGVELSDLHVVVGGHNIIEDCESEKAQKLKIAALSPHEQYGVRTGNDIAIVLLSEDIKFTEFIKPVHLPKRRYILLNEEVTAIGLGQLDCGGTKAETLQHVTLKVVDMAECQRAYEFQDVSLHDPTTKICTWEPGKDTCTGDSGGPLVYLPHRIYVQVGLISGGACGLKKPGINIDVFAYIEWIKLRIRQYGQGSLAIQQL